MSHMTVTIQRETHKHGSYSDHIRDCFALRCRECLWTICVTWYEPYESSSTPERALTVAQSHAGGHIEHHASMEKARG